MRLEAAEEALLALPHLLYRGARLKTFPAEADLRGIDDLHHFEEERVAVRQFCEIEEAIDMEGGRGFRDEEKANGMWQIAVAGLGKALE